MNTPYGNAVTTAEHAIALMMSLVRMIPQADNSTKQGKWEKSKFNGTEINGKYLGLIGCGNIGSIVASRAIGLKMKVIAYDPFLTKEKASELGVDKVDLEYLLDLWEECNGECFRFKIKMSLLDGDVWLVSLDRIDPSKGYIKGNVQLVSWQYNLMKGNRTEEEMDKVFDQLRLVYSNTSL